MEAIDVNKDGKIDFDEFVAAHLQDQVGAPLRVGTLAVVKACARMHPSADDCTLSSRAVWFVLVGP